MLVHYHVVYVQNANYCNFIVFITSNYDMCQCEGHMELSHTSIPLIHPVKILTPYGFAADSSQMTCTRLILGIRD